MVQNIFVYLFHPPFHAPMVSAVPVEGAAYACCLGNRVTLLSGTILFNFYCETPQETAVELLASWTCPATLVCNIILAGFVSSFHERQKLDIFMCPCWPKLQNLLQHHFFFFFPLLAPGCLLQNRHFRVELTAVEPNLLYIYILFLAAHWQHVRENFVQGD